MQTARTVFALLALSVLEGLALSYRPTLVPTGPRASPVAAWTVAGFLGIVAWGVALRRSWAEMLTIAVGLTVLPWAGVLSFTPSMGAPVTRQWLALTSALVLLMSAVGGGRTEDQSTSPDREAATPSSRHHRWIRWCLVLNVASVLHLVVFVAAYQFGASWQTFLFGGLLVGLTVGVSLLSRGKTVGLLLLAVCALLLVPAAVVFVGAEARSMAEAVFFIALFTPGIVAALGTGLVLLRPIAQLFGSAR